MPLNETGQRSQNYNAPRRFAVPQQPPSNLPLIANRGPFTQPMCPPPRRAVSTPVQILPLNLALYAAPFAPLQWGGSYLFGPRASDQNNLPNITLPNSGISVPFVPIDLSASRFPRVASAAVYPNLAVSFGVAPVPVLPTDMSVSRFQRFSPAPVLPNIALQPTISVPFAPLQWGGVWRAAPLAPDQNNLPNITLPNSGISVPLTPLQWGGSWRAAALAPDQNNLPNITLPNFGISMPFSQLVWPPAFQRRGFAVFTPLPRTRALFSVSVSEAASAVDVVSSSAVFLSAISEAASAADTATAKAVFKPAISESVSAADTVTAKAVFKPAIAEAASAADTVSTRAIFRPAIGEAANALDVVSTRAIFKPSLSEAANAVDQPSSRAVFRSALAEAASASDSASAVKQLMASLSDAMSALDVWGGTQQATWQHTQQFVALDTAYGSSAVDRITQVILPVEIDRNQPVSFFISVGYQIAPGQVFTAVMTRPDGTSFSVSSLRVQPQFSDVPTAIGRFLGGTYVFCFLNAGVLNQSGQWSVNVVSGTNVSAAAYFTVT